MRQGLFEPHVAVLQWVNYSRESISQAPVWRQAEALTHLQTSKAYVRHIAGKMMENETLAKQAAQNTKQQFGMGDFNTVLMDSVIDGLDNYKTMAEQVMVSERVKQEFAKIVLDVVYDGFKAQVGSAVNTAQR